MFAVSFSEASKPNLGEQNQMLITSTLTCSLHRSMISDLVNYYLLWFKDTEDHPDFCLTHNLKHLILV